MLPQGMRARCAISFACLDGLQNGRTWAGKYVQIVQIVLKPNRKLNVRHNAVRISHIPSAFARAYPNTVDEKFAQHWDTWFTESHVQQIVEAGINTVRVPVCITSTFYSILS